MGLFDQPDDLQLLRGGVSHASSSPSAVTLFLSRRFSRVRSATTSLSAVASRRRSLTSSEVAARAVSPARRFLTAGKGRLVLEALGISMADLTLRAIATDEDTRISLIGSVSSIMRATGNDVEKVKLLAEEITESPELFDELQERRER